MHGYRLEVIHDGVAYPNELISASSAAEVMDSIPKLLAAHPDCHRIHVYVGDTRLFSIDCTGANVDD